VASTHIMLPNATLELRPGCVSAMGFLRLRLGRMGIRLDSGPTPAPPCVSLLSVFLPPVFVNIHASPVRLDCVATSFL
jgi:hypothetical protein